AILTVSEGDGVRGRGSGLEEDGG
ncbi:hypothetical protein A2U01_0085762, partial [Trifolium medium]|nr:hypothetical protein [Trifolium medium]